MWSSMYSPAARPSRKRAPAAKNRQLSTVRSISKSMIERGLPTLRISRSWIVVHVVLDRVGDLAAASRSAAAASSRDHAVERRRRRRRPPRRRRRRRSPRPRRAPRRSPGCRTSSVSPDFAARHVPPMKFSRAMTASCPAGASVRAAIEPSRISTMLAAARRLAQGIPCRNIAIHDDFLASGVGPRANVRPRETGAATARLRGR